jgi:hypothetical protein
MKFIFHLRFPLYTMSDDMVQALNCEQGQGEGMLSRRKLLKVGGAFAAAHTWAGFGQDADNQTVVRPPGILIESHIHMISDDPVKFPFAQKTGASRPEPVEAFMKFALEASSRRFVCWIPSVRGHRKGWPICQDGILGRSWVCGSMSFIPWARLPQRPASCGTAT